MSVQSRARACVVVGVLGLASLYVFFVQTAHGQELDARLDAHRGITASARLLHGYNAYVALGEVVAVSALLLFALARGRLRRGLLCAALPVVTVVVADILKPTLPRPRLDSAIAGAGNNTFPSGHVGFAAATVAAFLLIAPVALRPLILTIGVPAVGTVMVAVVLAHWHRASDGLGSLFLVLALSGVVVLLSPSPTPSRSGSGYRERMLVS
jgi:membrane-associated phospholipid phosphatase